MRTILRFICILATVGALAAYGQEASRDAKEAAKATIAKAEIAIGRVSKSNGEFQSLSKKQEDGTIPMGEKE